jgi:futalosine hydrolase
VNRVLGNDAAIARAAAKYDPDVVNMEGAAVFYACALRGLQCIELRAISDKVARREKSAWNISGAVEAVCAKGHDLLMEIGAAA